jgi:hypothetical protein
LQLLLLLPPKGVHECDALHLHSCCLTLLLLLPASRLHECDVVTLEQDASEGLACLALD